MSLQLTFIALWKCSCSKVAVSHYADQLVIFRTNGKDNSGTSGVVTLVHTGLHLYMILFWVSTTQEYFHGIHIWKMAGMDAYILLITPKQKRTDSRAKHVTNKPHKRVHFKLLI